MKVSFPRSILPILAAAFHMLTITVANSETAPKSVSSDWFDVTYIDPGVYMIAEPKSSQYNISYLVLGDKRALMIDTGSGENRPVNGTKMRHIVEQLTDLPVTLVLSHFHFDHNANIGEFDHVAFIDLDYLRARVGKDQVYRFSRRELAIGSHPKMVKVAEWWPMNTAIDLGSRRIKLLSVPGHTRDSIVVLDEANKLAFTGDSFAAGFALLIGREGLDDYLRSVDSLIARLDEDYRFFGAHRKQKSTYAGLAGLKAVLTCFKYSTCPNPPKVVKIAGFPGDVYNVRGSALMFLRLPEGFYKQQKRGNAKKK